MRYRVGGIAVISQGYRSNISSIISIRGGCRPAIKVAKE
jgi:hypothetical protein